MNNGGQLPSKARIHMERFIDEYLIDMNGAQAAIRAGYAANSARVTASKMLAKANVQALLIEKIKALSETTELSQQWVLEQLKENVKRAMTVIEVVDKDGKKTGEFDWDGSVANRSLELIGKHLGMFADKHELSGPGGGPVLFEVSYEKKAE